MSVDDEADGLAAEALQSCIDPGGQCGVIVIDHNEAVLTDGHTNIFVLTLKHVDSAADPRDSDLNFGEIPVLRHAQRAADRKSDKENIDFPALTVHPASEVSHSQILHNPRILRNRNTIDIALDS